MFQIFCCLFFICCFFNCCLMIAQTERPCEKVVSDTERAVCVEMDRVAWAATDEGRADAAATVGGWVVQRKEERIKGGRVEELVWNGDSGGVR